MQINGYVIYLFSTANEHLNTYGYWNGKNYVLTKELFPETDGIVTERTKIYSSKKRAENALESCLNRGYAYVTGGEVRTIT